MEFFLHTTPDRNSTSGKLFIKEDRDEIKVGDRLYYWDGKQERFIGRALESIQVGERVRTLVPEGCNDTNISD